MGKRALIISISFLLIFLLLGGRVFRLSTDETAAAYSSGASVRLTVCRCRPWIFDCNMKPLADDTFEFKAIAKPTANAFRAVAEVADAPEYELAVRRAAEGLPVCIGVSKPVSDCDDVFTVSVPIRYSSSPLATHIIGYTDADGGVCGVEKAIDILLPGLAGECNAVFDADARGRILPGGDATIEDGITSFQAGVRLTINSDIQRIAQSEMRSSTIKKGACVITEVSTGEIKAMVSLPDFDQNNIAKSLEDEDKPLINRAVCAYSVGSIFKPVVAATALESGVSETKEFDCPGKITVDGVEFNCHNRSGHGVLDMGGALACSCNIYFIKLMLSLDPRLVIETARAVGFGEAAEICEGIYNAAGNLPDASELDSRAAMANFAFGQGTLTATPLQIACATACLVSEGLYRYPTLIKSVISSEGEEVSGGEKPPVRVISDVTALKIRRFMTGVVETGSGKPAKPKGCTAGGKTATAQTGIYKDREEILQTWFTGFFPAENPKLVITILCENGSSGNTDCAPVFAKIASDIYALYE